MGIICPTVGGLAFSIQFESECNRIFPASAIKFEVEGCYTGRVYFSH